MKPKRIWQNFNMQSSANRFDWILLEAARVRKIKQQEREREVYAIREADLAYRRPIWKKLDEMLGDREPEDASYK